MDAIHTVTQILHRCGGDNAVLPPTALFNEGWMLRLILDWAAAHPTAIQPLRFESGSRWYSEALLPSRFKPRRRGDTAGEGFTHADGVVGHFQLRSRRGDIELLPNARQLLVIEAKIASGLSAGTTRAPTFNQAARNVACIAHLLSSAGLNTSGFTSLGFVVLAPQARIEEGVFAPHAEKNAICAAVKTRAAEFDAEAVQWCGTYFEPTVEQLSVEAVSWENVLEQVATVDAISGHELRAFYDKCLEHNGVRARLAR